MLNRSRFPVNSQTRERDGSAQQFGDRGARDRVFLGQADRDASPAVERRMGAPDIDALSEQRDGDLLMRPAGLEEHEVSPRVGVAQLQSVEQQMPFVALLDHL